MPRRSKGARLYLRAARKKAGKLYPSVWVILDGSSETSTGCGADDRTGAEKAFSIYLAQKHQPERRQRSLDDVLLADVISIYLRDVAPGLANPHKMADRAKRLLTWWSTKRLSDVTGANCRAYAKWREKQVPVIKGGRRDTGGGARRDLQDLAAAIGHHHKEGLHREIVRVSLPARGKARQRWLTRSEFAKLLWVCWRTKETQKGIETKKRPLQHLVRFLLFGLYTGSRPGAIYSASWFSGEGHSFIDIKNGVFHRHAEGAVETNKRQPVVKLSPRLLAHLRRWKRLDAKSKREWLVEFDGAPVLSVKGALGRAVKLAELPDGVTAYTLRHSCASWLVAKGLPTRKVAEFLGTSEAMIINHYGHLAPDYQNDAAEQIGRQ